MPRPAARSPLATWPALGFAAAALSGGAPAQQPQDDALVTFVAARCVECHDAATRKGGLDLTRPPADAVDQLWRWHRAAARVRGFEMPPADADQPSAAERDDFLAAVAAKLRTEVDKLPPDPGRVTVRRLSRAQWANCVRDLFGIEVSTAAFPVDDLGYGFDTIGDALTFSTLHLESYLAAARAVAEAVIDAEDPARPRVWRGEAEAMRLVAGPEIRQDGDVAAFHTRATLAQEVPLPRDGIYRIRVVAGADQAGDEPAKLLLRLDGRDFETIEVTQRALGSFEIRTPLSGGAREFEITFVNDFYQPENPDPSRRDRNLHVDALEVIGPLDARPVPSAQTWLHQAVPPRATDAAALQAFARVLLPRVWRRPATAEELRRVVAAASPLLAAERGLAAGKRLVVQAALTSPHFLFRGEVGATGDVAGVVPLSGPALATRLAFFLWGSTPDPRLLDLAQRGKLAERPTWHAEIDRMLADPRADDLAGNFAAQWLELRNLAERTPDPARFPGFDDDLRASLRRETESLFLAVLRERRDVRELVDCDFTFVDARLAAFYGLPAPADPLAFARVTLPPEQRERGGVLGHGSVLAITSNPTRTSPVKRGKWILENLLGQPPPPPPPGNDSLANEAAVANARTFREQLAAHRAQSACAGCHQRMDALGFALERYDAIGRFRTEDSGGVIDCSGALPDGTTLDGLAALKRAVAGDPAFVGTLAGKLFVYAVGRELRPVDRLRLEQGTARLLAAGQVTLRDLILLVADDVAFQRRAGRAKN